MDSRSSGSKGGDWTDNLVFIDYEDHKPTKTTLNEEKLLNDFEKLKANEEEILKAKIWKYPLWKLQVIFGGLWHEYTVVKSTNWYWSFEKQMDGIYVQRSREITDVKDKLNGKDRSALIRPEGRSNDDINYKENIYNVIEWIINNGEARN
ncbi:hypothetical protein FO519_009856, partial [Halicephalobus sp. NKZ332]